MTTLSQRSFAAGEIAPQLYGRVDTVKYATGLRTCRNSIVMRHGGTSNRPGTLFVAETRFSDKLTRLIPFIFNPTQTYSLEFGYLYMRVIKNGETLSDFSKNATGMTNANPGVFTVPLHGITTGSEVYSHGFVGIPQLNNRNFKVVSLGAGTLKLNYMDGTPVDTTAFSAYTSGGTFDHIYEIVTPYVDTDLATLQYAQSADVMTLTHPSYAPMDLARLGDVNWTISTITFAPSIAAPTGVGISTAAGSADEWVVTAVKTETLEESLASATVGAAVVATSGAPVTISWSAVVGAQEYNVYKNKNGIFGYIGTAVGLSFVDNGIAADASDSHPRARNPFGSANNYPSAVNYFQQRKIFSNTNNDPEKNWASKTGQFKNFTTSIPLQDDDAVTWTMAGKQVNAVKHLVDLGKLVVMTTAGEWLVGGDAAGILRPGEINPQQNTYNGSSYLSPIVIGGNALYVQGRGGVIRDLGFDYQIDGYRGNDLTVFSAHFVDGFSMLDWSYQQIPHSVVWIVRNDGTLLGLTYVREHQVLGWHRHDFDGLVENVCAIPEGDEDAVYLVIKREVDGRSVRYIERFAQRRIDDIVDSVFMDASLSYDGRNTNAANFITLTSAGTWTSTENLTGTFTSGVLVASDVGNEIHVTGPNGDLIRITIESFGSATTFSGKPNKNVPVSMRGVPMAQWTRAVDELSGLWHIEGKAVSVLGDAFVVASPNNPSNTAVSVLDGTIALDKCYGVIHVGLPYVSDIETLNVDTEDAETLADKKTKVSKVTIFVEKSKGIWAGGKAPTGTDLLEDLLEVKIRNSESYDDPIELQTGVVDVNLNPEWNSNGRVFIRQIDPLPLSVLAVAPSGNYLFRGKGT